MNISQTLVFIVLLCGLPSSTFAGWTELSYGPKPHRETVPASSYDNYYVVRNVPQGRSQIIIAPTTKRTHLNVFYKFGNVSMTEYDGKSLKSNSVNQYWLDIEGNGTLQILITNNDDRRITFNIQVGKSPALTRTYRALLTIGVAVVITAFLIIIGHLKKKSVQVFDSEGHFRKLYGDSLLVALVTAVMGTGWVVYTVIVVGIYIYFSFVGVLLFLFGMYLMGFQVIEGERDELIRIRYLFNSIPRMTRTDLRTYQSFRIKKRKVKRGYAYAIEGINTSGMAVTFFEGPQNMCEEVVTRLNTYKGLNLGAPTVDESGSSVPVVTQVVTVTTPPAYAPNESSQPEISPSPPPYTVPLETQPITTVTSQMVQDVMASCSPQDQNAVLTLFYMRQEVVNKCFSEISDPIVLRTTLIQLAKEN